jgi:hypothetical protein
MSHSPYQEYNLLNLLYEFNHGMYVNYRNRLEGFSEITKSLPNPPLLDWRYDRNGQPLFFRMEFNTPLHFMLSHPICRFKAPEDYPIRRGDHTLCLKLAIVPAFCVTLNAFTVIKLWNQGAIALFSPTSDFLAEDKVFWEIPSPSQHLGPQYSSLNFILRYGADPRTAPTHYKDIMEMYFRYGFWSFPRPGFSCCTHMIHGSDHISTILKVAKSIYALGETFEEEIRIGFNEFRATMIRLIGLTKRNGQFRLSDTYAVLTYDVAREIERFRGRGFFVNGVISEFRRRSGGFYTFTTVAELGYADLDLIKSVIGMVVADRFQRGDSLTSVGTMEEVRTETEELIERLWPAGQLTTPTMADGLKDLFENALLDLRPIIMNDGEEVLFIHPNLFSCLTEFDLFGRLRRIENGLLYALRLLELISTNTDNPMNTPETAYLQQKGITIDLLRRALTRSVEGIRFSRALNVWSQVEHVDSESS